MHLGYDCLRAVCSVLCLALTRAEPLGSLVTGKQVKTDGLTREDYLSLRSHFNDPSVGDEFLFGPMLRGMLEQLMGADLHLVRGYRSNCLLNTAN